MSKVSFIDRLENEQTFIPSIDKDDPNPLTFHFKMPTDYGKKKLSAKANRDGMTQLEKIFLLREILLNLTFKVENSAKQFPEKGSIDDKMKFFESIEDQEIVKEYASHLIFIFNNSVDEELEKNS